MRRLGGSQGGSRLTLKKNSGARTRMATSNGITFVLKAFTDKTLSSTTEEWTQYIAANEMFDLEYRRVLETASKQINYKAPPNGEPMSYGVFPKAGGSAVAIVSIVYTPRPGATKGWLKMLEVSVAPQYDELNVAGDIQKYQELLWIFSAAAIGTLALSDVHKSKVVKLYGRNESMLRLLVAVGEKLQQKTVDGVTASMQGRWLVIGGKKV